MKEGRGKQSFSSSEQVFQAHKLVYHSTLGLRVIKKKKTNRYALLANTWVLQGYLAHKKQPPPLGPP